MDRELVHDYLSRTGMDAAQSEALSRILAEMATKSDLLDLRREIAALEARLTWRIIGAFALMATLMTVLDVFID